MNDDLMLLRGGVLLMLVIAVIGGVSYVLGPGSTSAMEGGGPVAALEGGTSRAAPPEGSGAAAAATARTESCRVAEPTRSLPEEIHESSGVAASRRQGGVFWTHNDSGDPVLYAVGGDGELVGPTAVQGADVQDWEDLAIGPCPGGECLYVGDIGDNAGDRPHVTVYRVPEPAPGEARTRPAEALHARYPDGPQDAEALFVLPTAEIYVVTKGENGPVGLYRFPADAGPGRTVQLERVRRMTAGEVPRRDRITGAGASPDGRWIAVRTLGSLSLHPARDFLRGGEDRVLRRDLADLQEAQGEAVGFAEDGALVLTSEGGKAKDPATFARLECDL